MLTKKLIAAAILICILGAVGGYLFELHKFTNRDGWYILGGIKFCIALVGFFYWKSIAKWVTLLWIVMYAYVIIEHLIRYINFVIKKTEASNWTSDTGLSPLLFVISLFVFKLFQVYAKQSKQ